MLQSASSGSAPVQNSVGQHSKTWWDLQADEAKARHDLDIARGWEAPQVTADAHECNVDPFEGEEGEEAFYEPCEPSTHSTQYLDRAGLRARAGEEEQAEEQAIPKPGKEARHGRKVSAALGWI